MTINEIMIRRKQVSDEMDAIEARHGGMPPSDNGPDGLLWEAKFDECRQFRSAQLTKAAKVLPP